MTSDIVSAVTFNTIWFNFADSQMVVEARKLSSPEMAPDCL